MFPLRAERTRDNALVTIGGYYHLHSCIVDPNLSVRVIGTSLAAPSWLNGFPSPLLVLEDELGNTMKAEAWQLSLMHPSELARFVRHSPPTFPPRLKLVESR